MGVFVEKFADVKILRYNVTDFAQFDLKRKLYIYYLSQAALCGRDILWDQNNRFNLRVRAVLEHLYCTFPGDRQSNDFFQFEVYLKRVWFSNGIHHHYSTEKIVPDFTVDYFDRLVRESSPLGGGLSNDVVSTVRDVIFNPEREGKRVCLDTDKDLVEVSSNNYYQEISQAEAETYYSAMNTPGETHPVSYGLNSRLVKEDGQIHEKVWRVNGLYGQAIEQIVLFLRKACGFAENDQQQKYIQALIEYYETGNLAKFDEYNILWLKELDGQIDFVNGFIEVYGDPLGIKGSWESIVNFKDVEASVRASVLSENASWFEANSPVDEAYKKDKVKGVSAKVIHVAMLGGDCHPATPIGINLPNSEWIREEFGSKSVTIENITQAYFDDSANNGMLEEFAGSDEEIRRAREFGYLAGNLHTDLHECLGHGSGKMLDGVRPEDLKNYYSTIEETRADLFALYFMMDPKMLELGLLPSVEAAKAEYDAYLRNGLMTQLTRIEPGKDIEESHMRNRQLIARWVLAHGEAGRVLEFVQKSGRTFIRINDYQALQDLFGQLLHEIQRVKSEGDFDTARNLVETYGVKVDPKIHAEVLERYQKLGLAPYAGFLNPVYSLMTDRAGNITDVVLSEPATFAEQMLNYSSDYSFLPLVND